MSLKTNGIMNIRVIDRFKYEKFGNTNRENIPLDSLTSFFRNINDSLSPVNKS